tara:strand:+ start:47255 stop:49927 length:2673 start_codon:yes stop_codon:yes gene_type:complete
MVFLTALALFAFVVLPAMDSYMRRGGTGVTDAELASFDGKPLKRSRVEYLTRNHQSTVRFLRELAEETIRRGGAPQTPGFVYDSQNRQIQSIGINEQPSELGTVRTIQFANEAKKSGFELDDTAISSWLYSFTDQGTVPENEMLAMLMQSTRNQMGKFHLYEQLRSQLLAGLYQRGNISGLVVNQQIPVVTPVEQWENFLKLNRQATVNTYGVMVSDYLDQTNETPTESAIQETYEAGKDRYPNEQSADPAFRRRETATFQYVVADQLAFIEREKKNIDESALRAEYEKRLAGGDFQMPTTANDILGFGDEEAMDDDAEMTEPESSEASETEASATEETAPEEAATEPTADTQPSGDEQADSEKASDEASAEESNGSEPSETESQTSDADDDPADDQSSIQLGSAIRLVAFQDDEAGDADTADATDAEKPKNKKGKDQKANKKDRPKKDDSSTSADKNSEADSDNKPADDKPADDGKQDKSKEQASNKDKKADKADDGDAEKDSAKQEDTKQGNAESNEAKETKDMQVDSDDASEDDTAADQSQETKPADKSATVVDEPQQKEPEEPKVESFEDVRDQIASDLAAPEARRKLTEGINDIDSQMRRYFNLKAIHESNLKIGRDSEAPTKPDLAALAEKYGMQLETIGPHDIASLRNEPIAQSSELSNNVSQPGPPFTAMMFGVSNNQGTIPKQQLFFPLKTADMNTGKVYVSWKTEEKDAYTPSLDEVRDEVVMAIRMEEARDLARTEAVRLADKANEGEPLESLIPEDKKSNLKEALGPFSWMTSFGFGGAFLGNVPELDSVGEEFMAETFRTKEGEFGVAANLPERVVYVIEPTGFQPSTEELKRRFKQPRERMMAMLMGVEDVQSVINGFYESIDKRTGFNYVAPEEE